MIIPHTSPLNTFGSTVLLTTALFASIALTPGVFPPSTAIAEPVVVGAGRAPSELSEIVATGDSVAVIAPDHATITASLSQTSATAAEAVTKLDTTTNQLREALKPLGTKWHTHLRDERYAPGSQNVSGQNSAPLSATTSVTVKRDLAVETDDPTKVGAAIDLLTKLAGVTVTDVSFSVRSASSEQLELLTKASALAKVKAEKMATGLGVKLGRMLSAQLTEEPDGAVIRERMAQGESPLNFQDQRVKLYVTVRYEAVQ